MRVVRVVLADPRALLGLRAPLADGLAHLERHELAVPTAALAQQGAGAVQDLRSLVERGALPLRLRRHRAREPLLDSRVGRLFVLRDHLAGRRIDRRLLLRHGLSLFSMRGNGMVSRMCGKPQIQETARSTPRPNPA